MHAKKEDDDIYYKRCWHDVCICGSEVVGQPLLLLLSRSCASGMHCGVAAQSYVSVQYTHPQLGAGLNATAHVCGTLPCEAAN